VYAPSGFNINTVGTNAVQSPLHFISGRNTGTHDFATLNKQKG